MKETTGIIIQNLANQLIASNLRYFIISCAIAFGILFWSKALSVFSFNWKRLFSYFLFSWAFNQIFSGFFLELHGIREKISVLNFLGAYLHPLVFNLKTYIHWYQEPPVSVFYQNSSYIPLFQFVNVLYWSTILPAILSVSLSLGFFLWKPKIELKKFSIKRLISIFFFLIAAIELISPINQFFSRSTYLSIESINALKQENSENINR